MDKGEKAPLKSTDAPEGESQPDEGTTTKDSEPPEDNGDSSAKAQDDEPPAPPDGEKEGDVEEGDTESGKEPPTSGGDAEQPPTSGEDAEQPPTSGEDAEQPPTSGEDAEQPPTLGGDAEQPPTSGGEAEQPPTSGGGAGQPPISPTSEEPTDRQAPTSEDPGAERQAPTSGDMDTEAEKAPPTSDTEQQPQTSEDAKTPDAGAGAREKEPSASEAEQPPAADSENASAKPPTSEGGGDEKEPPGPTPETESQPPASGGPGTVKEPQTSGEGEGGKTAQPEGAGESAKETGQKVEEGKEEADKTKAKEEVIEEEEEEEEQVFEYDYNVMKSTPEVVDTPVNNMLELHHSFGYECHKRFNLVVLAVDVVAYSAGNMVVILSLDTHQQTCFRSLGGGGIGAIAVHPSQSYLAVGEKGVDPVIAIYTYPELELHRILRGGTEAMYSHMDFSPGDGKLLASIGGDPDFMLTVWDWMREKIVLRSKAFSQDIYRVSFSPENAQQLTTSGTGHIRFWKMAHTFTGLKLQGQLGKFGRIEISDISAYVELPDGKVLSGTEWGNFLLWDGGFIKVELSKKGKKPCHNGMIEAIYLDEGELISAGVDGYIKVWNFETIDSADISDESATFEIEPMSEIKVGHNVCFKSLVRSVDPETINLWYGQDASGAIWKIDIVVSHTRRAPEKLMNFHGGRITGVVCSPITHQAASISQSGSIRVYNLPEKQLLCHSEFASGGSCLLWAPTAVDKEAFTLIAGFADGVVRVLRMEEKQGRSSTQHKGHSGKNWLNLVHACKPHKKAVTAMAVDQEGKLLASGGEDGIVFFLSIEEDYSPIGYINAPAAVQTLQWSSGDECYLLVCCVDGSMMEVEAPVKGDYDTSKTYYLDPLKYTTRQFASIKDRLRAEEEAARKEAEKRRKLKLKEIKRQKRKELMGEDYVSEEEEEEEEEVEEEEDEVKAVFKGPSPILVAFYSKEDPRKYWVSMDGYDAGYLYRCSLEGATQDSEPYEPTLTIPIPKINEEDTPLHSVSFSASGEYLLTGSSNGCVRLHPLSTPHTLRDLSSYWSVNMHDNHYGAVTCLCSSFDDQYVISGGNDGNLFVYKANLPTAAQRAKAILLQIPKQSEETALDIDDPEHYSIEDAKQKAEHDKKMKLAEEKKLHVRRQIASLRRTFAKLQNRNLQLPPHLQLGPEAFVMDPDMEKSLVEQGEEKMELVRREMNWESEKHRIGLDKLNIKYKNIVDCQHFMVWAFNGQHHASSFRTPKPSKEFLKCLEAVTQSDPTSTANYPWTTGTGQRSRILTGKQSKRTVMEAQSSAKTGKEGEREWEVDEETFREMTKEERRKYRKKQRAYEITVHEKKRPDEKSEDPVDAREFKHARDNMGDYKLKTAKDYVVPKAQRITTDKKRKELLLLRHRILDTKKDYNDKLLTLRDKKLQIIEKIKALVERITELQSKLNPAHHKPLPPIPTIRPEEVPERRDHYTRESLLRFKDDQAAREEAERQDAAGMGDGGFFGGFGGGGEGEGEEGTSQGEEGEEKTDTRDERDTTTDGTLKSKHESQATVATGTVEFGEGGEVSKGEGEGEEGEGRTLSEVSSEEELLSSMTPTQRLIYQEQQIRCLYERDHILAEVEQLQKEFDDVLMRLCHEKVHLDITVVAADIKHITQFEEMELLREFDKRESTFTSRYRTKKKEKEAMAVKIAECERDITEREKLLAKVQEQEKTLTQTFVGSIGDNNKFKDFILKVFRKKIKRVKHKEAGEDVLEAGEEEQEEEDDDEDTDSDISSSGTDSEAEGELDDTVCPAGCDQVLFARACELREERLDLEERITEEKKGLDIQRKDLEGMKKKAKSMESQVNSAHSDLQAFQLKKQQRLNELDQVAVLCLHQLLHYQPHGEPPCSIAPCLVFPASALFQLGQRIGELTQEKLHEKKRYKELKQSYRKLGREKKEKLAALTHLNERVNEAMLEKFGQIVDLEKLEVLSSNPVIEEKREQLRLMDEEGVREANRVQAMIVDKRRELVHLKRENTKRLKRKHALITTMTEIGERLDARQKSMSKEVAGGDCYLTPEEHEKLLEIIRMQAVDIDNVRVEIEALRHKGGHILPPTQPPAAPPSV